MQKEILLQLLEQNRKDCSHFCENITTENLNFRLNEQTASIGFIYRHIGETTNLLGTFFGYKAMVEGTTIGHHDTGMQYDLETSRELFKQGYSMLQKLVNETSDEEWLEEIKTTWFGEISRIKLFSLTLFHNSHHCGQIALTIVKGK